jgi:hypothetical protein
MSESEGGLVSNIECSYDGINDCSCRYVGPVADCSFGSCTLQLCVSCGSIDSTVSFL